MRDKLIENALYEMAMNAGDGEELSYLDTHAIREKIYNETKSSPVAFDNVHVLKSGTRTEYATLDHDHEEATHHSLIKHRPAGHRNIPFEHDEQVSVNSIKNKHPGRSLEIMLHHVEHSGYPLVSSNIQSYQGHALWKKFVQQSLTNRYHCYYNEHGNLHEIDDTNIDMYHKRYFGDALKHEETNLVVSKKSMAR